MSLYDPLGLVVPFLLPLKLFVQDLVIHGYGWDEPLREEHDHNLDKCLDNIRKVEKIKVCRCLTTNELGRVVK